MFGMEDNWMRFIRKSRAKALDGFNVNGQRQWKVDERCDAEGVDIPGSCVFAQNEAYLELCNPGWAEQRIVMFGLLGMTAFSLLIIWMWYGFAVHPILFGHIFEVVRPSTRPADWGDYAFGWGLFFPLAVGAAFLIFAGFYYMGGRTLFFTYARGRIRFNRMTRKVYVLRPGYCGGNKVFDWDRLVALCDLSGGGRKSTIKALALYHPPLNPGDQPARGPAQEEDCIFVGCALPSYSAAAPFWEYIRRYMQDGPTVDKIPPNAPVNYKHVPRFVPADYGTYCGKPGYAQYRLEVRPGFMEATFHMLSQMTCSWPKFPKEWGSDSGLGEPEDRPVQTGATMTALVYRAKNKLTAADEVEFLTHWGTPEALAEAKAKLA